MLTLVWLRLTVTIHHYSWLLVGASSYVGTCRGRLNDMLAASTISTFSWRILREWSWMTDFCQQVFIFHPHQQKNSDLFVDLSLAYLLILLHVPCGCRGRKEGRKEVKFIVYIRLAFVRKQLTGITVTESKNWNWEKYLQQETKKI